MNNFQNTLKEQIIEELSLDVNPGQIDVNAPLFGEGLGLDSIDGLELVVLLEKYYDIKVGTEENMQEIFSSVANLADYITRRTTVAAIAA